MQRGHLYVTCASVPTVRIVAGREGEKAAKLDHPDSFEACLRTGRQRSPPEGDTKPSFEANLFNRAKLETWTLKS